MDESVLINKVLAALGSPPTDAPIFLLRVTGDADPLLYQDIDTPGGAQGNSGTDLRFPKAGMLGWSSNNNGRPETIDLKVRVRCVDGGLFVPYEIRARSSIGKTPLLLANSVGTIDRGYTGNLRVAVHNLSTGVYEVQRGESLFQLVAPGLKPARVIVVTDDRLPEELRAALFGDDATARGTGGFGSTGAGGVRS